MRVRNLQSHLAEHGLVRTGKLASLRGLRVGVDAVFWLRSVQNMKDPFADALGGIPPGIFGFLDKELELFRRHEITPMFIFQGVAPGPQNSSFTTRMDQYAEQAWAHLGGGRQSEAQRCFALSSTRINGDFVYFIFQHLRHRGYECLQAPYFAGAQLAHFAEQGVVQAVFGPPGLLLYGVRVVAINLAFHAQTFDWVELDDVLWQWNISQDQFVDACMLAGTEYCLSYPYLRNAHCQLLDQPWRFNFDAAVSIIKQAPLIDWMEAFPTECVKNDYVERYCICKVIVQNSPVFHLSDGSVRPLGSAACNSRAPSIPRDFHAIVGEKLPNNLYGLILQGTISHKLPQALARGEWTDKTQPLVDTAEFRTLLVELTDYREIALGLIARHLPKKFQEKRVLCKAFYDPHPIQQSLPGENNLIDGARLIRPRSHLNGLRWDIRTDAVQAEMQRQGADMVDFKFCVIWHRHAVEHDGPLVRGITERGLPQCSNDLNSLAALVHFMVLEHLELISGEDGGMTMLEVVLSKTPRRFQEPCLVALEMMKFGILSGDPFNAAGPEGQFPWQVQYPSAGVGPTKKSVMLLSRAMSLVPMKLKKDMWNAHVEFDLAAFHSLVRILKRTLRQIVEACLASVLLEDLSKLKLLPANFMCASPLKDDHLATPAVLPTFMLSRACMGILVVHLLTYHGSPESFRQGLAAKFPCCVQPLEDLRTAIDFWKDLKRCVDTIAEPLGAEELASDMQSATEELQRAQDRLRIR